MRCKECKYAKAYQRRRMVKRSNCYCTHPNQNYIIDYFKDNKIKKAIGFISYSEPYSNIPLLKTSPKWCPLKKDNTI